MGICKGVLDQPRACPRTVCLVEEVVVDLPYPAEGVEEAEEVAWRGSRVSLRPLGVNRKAGQSLRLCCGNRI